MIISLTGTPGTGKTSISRFLRKNNINIIDLNKIINKNKSLWKIDYKRNTLIIDIKKLNNLIKNESINNNIILIDGHLSHLLSNIDKVILLRCQPKELINRLKKRKWKNNKIIENVEAEILDIILCECVNKYSKKNIFEIDTTKKKINEISNIILEIINNNFKNTKDYSIGKINWSNEIFNIKL